MDQSPSDEVLFVTGSCILCGSKGIFIRGVSDLELSCILVVRWYSYGEVDLVKIMSIMTLAAALF